MKNTSEYVVQTLIDDEDMSADLASLYPAASKIGDAAAAFIDKADQTIEKKGLMGTPAETVAKCIDICQNVAAISRLLRNPRTCDTAIVSRWYEETNHTTEDDGMTQSTLEDVE